CARDGNYFDYW
nr:immunoglobulin heavy chain junction region [Mus musculus]MBK4183918.1 immunoglobulin heavy chain junction region [Mus musculus]